MDNGKLLNDLRREVEAAWQDGCNCELCLAYEVDQQFGGNHLAFLMNVWTYCDGKHHGDGWWAKSLCTMRWSNVVRRQVGWPTLESVWDRPRHPTYRPN